MTNDDDAQGELSFRQFVLRHSFVSRISPLVIFVAEEPNMHAFQRGELLIGGMALRQLRGELDREEPANNSSAWLLSGKLRFSAQHGSQLELERQYLLRIDDGREGLVELTSLTASDGDLLANFRPRSITRA